MLTLREHLLVGSVLLLFLVSCFVFSQKLEDSLDCHRNERILRLYLLKSKTLIKVNPETIQLLVSDISKRNHVTVSLHIIVS
jgi:hypothetical protein